MLDQNLGAHELLAIAILIVASRGAASLSHRLETLAGVFARV
jgi:hypothetical protein